MKGDACESDAFLSTFYSRTYDLLGLCAGAQREKLFLVA